MKHIGIVMAAGKGTRIGGDMPKQYMDLKGKPVLYYPLRAMQESFIDEIIVVVGKGDEAYVRENIVDKYAFSKVTEVVSGGKERSDSVYEGLKRVKEPKASYVYIQDGARPMLNGNILERVRQDVEQYGASIAAVRAKDTIKIGADGFVKETPDRSDVWVVQTPQAFKGDELLAAYEKMRGSGEVKVTDDASVMEAYGHRAVHIAEGDYRNIKITTVEDFTLAEEFIV